MEYTKKYQYFIKIVDSGSISSAAKELNLAQPFLSSFLKDLENKLNCTLIDRSAKPYELTDEGKAFYTAAKSILTQEKLLANTIAGLKNRSVILNIGVGSTRVKNLIGDTIVNFLRNNPNVKLNIIEILNTDAYETLENGSADIVVHFNDLSDKTIISNLLYLERLVLIKSNKLIGDDVFSMPRIVLPEGQLVRTISDDICKKGKIVLECDKLETALYYVNKGVGTTIVPSYLVNDVSNIEKYEIIDERCNRNIYVSYKKKDDAKEAVISFVNTLLNAFISR